MKERCHCFEKNAMYNFSLHVKVQCTNKAANNHQKVHNIVRGQWDFILTGLVWSLDGELSRQFAGRSVSCRLCVTLCRLGIGQCKNVALHTRRFRPSPLVSLFVEDSDALSSIQRVELGTDMSAVVTYHAISALL